MRIAVCISGQPRVSTVSLSSIKTFFLGKKPKESKVDFFIHTWDYINCNNIEENRKGFYVNPKQVQILLEKEFNPVKIQVEHWDPENAVDLQKPFLPGLYSLKRVISSWEEYSSETKVEYDWIFYTRLDTVRLLLDPPYNYQQLDWNSLPKPTEDRVTYRIDCSGIDRVSWAGERKHYIVGDFSWFASPAAAKVLKELYEFWNSVEKSLALQEWIQSHLDLCGNEIWAAESRWAIYTVFTGIDCQVSLSYDVGWPIRLAVEQYDLTSPLGRKFLVEEIYKNEKGWFYTEDTVKSILDRKPEYRDLPRSGLLKRLRNEKSNLI